MSTLAETGIAPLIDLPYAEQLALRQAKVARMFNRLDVEVRSIIPSELQEGSRARVKLRGGPGGLGFHLPGSHEHLVVGDELARIARPEVVAGVNAIAGLALRGAVEVRSDGERVVYVLDQPATLPEGASFAVGGKRRAGNPTLQVDGLRVSPNSFLQVNLEVNRRIVDDVDALLQELQPIHLLDLYGGIGNLSARAHRRGTPVTLVESEGQAAEDARKNLKGAEVLAMDVARWKPGQTFFDIALLDPPRAGAPGILDKLIVTRPRAIVYLSCDPGTLAKDIGALHGRGYRIRYLQPYDMFPGTDHVETLAVLDRG